MGGIGDDISREIAERFLSTYGHGVLSMAKGNDGFGIPISYGYDASNDCCIVQFISDSESQKRQFLETSETVTLTTYTYSPNGDWQSVIATGSLESLSDEEVADWAAEVFFSQAADVYTSNRKVIKDAEIAWYALELETLTGRKSGDDNGVDSSH